MQNNDIYDLVIVGGGAGGLSAAIYAMRASMKTLLVEMGLPGGQMINSDEVENYPGFERIGGQELSEKFAQHAKSYGLEMITKEVEAVEPGLEYHQVRTTDGGVANAHAVIIATGGSPRKLAIPGEDEYYGKGISYCAVCDGFFFKDRDVVVVGGGDTAVEESLYLSKIAKKVTLTHRREELRAGRLLQQRLMSECNAEILWNTVVTEIKANDLGVSAVTLKDTKTEEERDLSTDGVFIFIGFIPNNSLIPAGTKLNADGYVITDVKCETNIPGIFAIGDLREKYARQIVLSAGDGCTAALAAAYYVESKKAKTDAACELPD